jgi:hypothetical protein
MEKEADTKHLLLLSLKGAAYSFGISSFHADLARSRVWLSPCSSSFQDLVPPSSTVVIFWHRATLFRNKSILWNGLKISHNRAQSTTDRWIDIDSIDRDYRFYFSYVIDLPIKHFLKILSIVDHKNIVWPNIHHHTFN